MIRHVKHIGAQLNQFNGRTVDLRGDGAVVDPGRWKLSDTVLYLVYGVCDQALTQHSGNLINVNNHPLQASVNSVMVFS